LYRNKPRGASVQPLKKLVVAEAGWGADAAVRLAAV